MRAGLRWMWALHLNIMVAEINAYWCSSTCVAYYWMRWNQKSLSGNIYANYITSDPVAQSIACCLCVCRNELVECTIKWCMDTVSAFSRIHTVTHIYAESILCPVFSRSFLLGFCSRYFFNCVFFLLNWVQYQPYRWVVWLSHDLVNRL